MASNNVKPNRMKRMESKKTYSWWWDSHVCPKNSKWLQDNLEEMDQHVKRMLKLIEEDADSFAKKAEMYYQKRPQLISLVEDFYRMYRSLAERYDHVTGELRKNIPSDLQSQSSGISDVGSEPPSTMASPDRRRPKSGPRAAGFGFFLGNGGERSDLETESESESEEDSSVNNYSGNDDELGLRRKIIELEVELREVKEKLQARDQVVDISEGHFDQFTDDDGKKDKYEEQLRVAREEIGRLTIELQKYNSLEDKSNSTEVEQNQESVNDRSEGEVLDSVNKIETLEEELRITQEKLHNSEDEIVSLRQELTSKGSSIDNLQDELKLAEKELEKEKREVLKLQERITRYKTNLSDRDQEIRGLKEAMSNANKSLSEENEQLKMEITRISKERASLEDNLKEGHFDQFTNEDGKKDRYEEQLRVANEEIGRLTIELRKYNSLEDNNNMEVEKNQESVDGRSAGEVLKPVNKIETLEEELRITQEKLQILERELMIKGSFIENLQDGLKLVENELEKEKREVLKLQERVTQYKTNLSDRDQEIRALKDEAMSNAKNEQLKTGIMWRWG